jgi:diguanylate cyclase (GGDEF)-like protein
VLQGGARAARHPDYGFAVVLVEIRGLDQARKRLGRFGAEELLADFAERVIWCIRPSDVITRLGDDDFAIVLDDVNQVTNATRVAVRVHDSMTEAMTLAAQVVPLKLSIGVSISLPGEVRDSAAMLSEAESALERARALERPYVVFDPEHDRRSVEDLSLETGLMKSLDRDELRMAYSPLVASDTGQLVGFSALLQWEQPGRGITTARNFIQIAESSREILRIGAWAVTEACATLAIVAETVGRPMIVSVNVGEVELSRGDVAGVVERALANHQHLAAYLRIEVPASALTNIGPALESTISRLHAFGVGVHLDHIVGNNIPLRRALHLDVEGVRVNLASFDSAESDVNTLTRMLAACRTFAREVVVEGIESPETATVVASLDPPVMAQGFYFGKLRNFDEAVALAPTRQRLLPALPAKEQRDVS